MESTQNSVSSRCSINATCCIPVISRCSFLSYEGFWDWGQLGFLPKMTRSSRRRERRRGPSQLPPGPWGGGHSGKPRLTTLFGLGFYSQHQ